MTDLKDKFMNTKDKIVGEVKEAVGKVTGNEELELEGKFQSTKSDVTGAANEFKDDFVDKDKGVFDKYVDNNKDDRVLDRDRDLLDRSKTEHDNNIAGDLGTVYDKNIVGDMGVGIDSNKDNLNADYDKESNHDMGTTYDKNIVDRKSVV